MKSGKIVLSILAIAALVVCLFSIQSAFAANNAISGAGTTVVVNGLVSITLTNTSLTFADLDPGANYSMATSGLGITVDGVTNVGTSVYLNGTNFTSGANGFLVGNLTYKVSSVSPITMNTSCSSALNCTYSLTKAWIFDDTARLGTPNLASVNHWISVPDVQAPGTYTNIIRVCAEQVGSAAC